MTGLLFQRVNLLKGFYALECSSRFVEDSNIDNRIIPFHIGNARKQLLKQIGRTMDEAGLKQPPPIKFQKLELLAEYINALEALENPKVYQKEDNEE